MVKTGTKVAQFRGLAVVLATLVFANSFDISHITIFKPDEVPDELSSGFWLTFIGVSGMTHSFEPVRSGVAYV